MRTLIIIDSATKGESINKQLSMLHAGSKRASVPEVRVITPGTYITGRQYDVIINGIDYRMMEGQRLIDYDIWLKRIKGWLEPGGVFLDLGNGEGN